MITYIKINGFKSFYNFEMEFTPFTVVAGANGSGKSNLFDALRLLAGLAGTDSIKKAFNEQRAEFMEVFTQYGSGNYAKEIAFEVEMLVSKHLKDAWGNEATIKYTRLKYALTLQRFTNAHGMEEVAVTHERLEKINPEKDKWIKIIPTAVLKHWLPRNDDKPVVYMQTNTDANPHVVEILKDSKSSKKKQFPLKNATRTVLSSFDTIEFPHILAAKTEMLQWKYLQLNPDDLRQPTNKRGGETSITSTGKNLAGALYRMQQQNEYAARRISTNMLYFLVGIDDIHAIDDTEKNQYCIKVKGKHQQKFSTHVLSEGSLRALALCIIDFDDEYSGLICLEEPENGIHPARMKDLIKVLENLTVDFNLTDMTLRQLIINTHSPILISNLLEWKKNANISMSLSRKSFATDTINGERERLYTTKITPFISDGETMIDLSAIEKKFIVNEAKEYLATTNLQSTNLIAL
jgi:predicted ATPase